MILSCKVFASTGDLQGALRTFQSTIKSEDFEHAVRIFALVLRDFKKAGAYEAARSGLEEFAVDNQLAIAQLQRMDEYAVSINRNPDNKTISNVVIGTMVALLFVL